MPGTFSNYEGKRSMAAEIIMPKWGLSMQKGTITNWLKAEGDEVQAGEELVEIESDKITNVVEAPASGILARIVHPEGAEVPVTHLIAIITAPGEAVPEVIPSGAAMPAPESQPEPKTAVKAPTIAPAPPANGKIRAMPVARKMARAHGLDLATIQGTGRGGAITKADVEQALASRTAAATPTVKPLQKVSFYSEGHKLAGLLYSPENAAAGSCPAVVLCAGYTYLKEMVMPNIAKLLAEAGYVALAFDYRGFGESGGPRWRLIPEEQINDIRAALTFLTEQPHVDRQRLATLGISLGGAHAITVGAIDQRVSAVVALEPVGDGQRWLRSLRRYTEWVEFEQKLIADRRQRVLTGVSERVDPLAIVLPDPASEAFFGRRGPRISADDL